MAIVILLALLILWPFVLMFVGFVMRVGSTAARKERGRKLMLWGAILLAAEILIGYAFCSNMRFNMH